jgi:hypothetical protein
MKSLPIQNSKPFHSIEETITGASAGDIIGMTEDGTSLGIYGDDFPIVYGLAIDVIDNSVLIIDAGYCFDEPAWGLTKAEKRLLCKAGVVVTGQA